MMAEREPEAIMPLKRTRSGRLGIETAGGGGNTYNVNFSVRGVSDQNAWKRSGKQHIDDLTDAMRRLP
jgi:phage-related minor tail protein